MDDAMHEYPRLPCCGTRIFMYDVMDDDPR